MPATQDLFTPIHKALRSMIYSLGGRLQSHDFRDVEATATLVSDLEHDFAVARSAGCVLCVLHQHADDEERAIFPPAGRFDSELVASLIQEHHDLTRQELAIANAAHELRGLADADARIRAGAVLNRAANALFADYLSHMNREERELVPRMQARFTDPELVAMRAAILGATPPERLMAILGWMAPSLNYTELVSFLGGVQRSAPPPVLKAISELCAAKVDPARWAEVKTQLGL